MDGISFRDTIYIILYIIQQGDNLVKVLNAIIRWMEGWNTRPELEILVDKIPTDLIYEEKDGFYFAEKDGYVSFYHHSGNPVRQQGYGGSAFTLHMKDGSIKQLIGPWSSRPSCLNEAGFTPSENASIYDSKESWDRGFTAYAGHITQELFRRVVSEYCPSITISVKTTHYGESFLLLSRVDNPCEVCKGAKCYTWAGKLQTCHWCDGTGHNPIK